MRVEDQMHLKEIIDRFLKGEIYQQILFIIPRSQDKSVGEREIIVRNMLLDVINIIDYKFKFFPIDMFEVSVEAAEEFCGRLEKILEKSSYRLRYMEKMNYISKKIEGILKEKAEKVGDKIVVIYNISSVKDTFDFDIERIIDIFWPSRMIIILPNIEGYTSSLSRGKIEWINV